MNSWPILTHELRTDQDVVIARQRARQIAALVGFDNHDQTRIGTAVSEIARNAYRYAGGGFVSFEVTRTEPQQLVVTVRDRGRGIPDTELVFSGNYVSTTGMGIGLAGARRLVDDFDLRTGPDGTTVTLRKKLAPHRVVGSAEVRNLADELQKHSAASPVDELQEQNRELLRALDELQVRQLEIQRLNHELAETNQGVLALNAELEDKAESLRSASETKSRFLSHMSHEFRTPLNSIRSLAAMLASRLDGPLTQEQERQVEFIRKGADTLLELINDLLDLAKIEAGKVDVTPTEFTVETQFAALRGMFRPLLSNDAVALRFVEMSKIPPLFTDETKLSQILRNLVSNALKYTESGEVVVTAAAPTPDFVSFSVRDTGIGIASEHIGSLFNEFVQITNPLQTRSKGTGLGLSLSQRLAGLLGGGIEVESEFGRGSTFTVTIPRRVRDGSATQQRAEPLTGHAVENPVVLIVDDEDADRYALRVVMPPTCEILEATSGEMALDRIARRLPDVVFLDLGMPGMGGLQVLEAIKSAPDTRDVRVIVNTSVAMTEELRRRILDLGAEAVVPKGYTDLETMRTEVARLITRGSPERDV